MLAQRPGQLSGLRAVARRKEGVHGAFPYMSTFISNTP
jgi:hypothetical protein